MSKDATPVAESVELLPCPNPWCEWPRGNAVAHNKREGFRVLCNCGVATPRYATDVEAIGAWNTRADPAIAASYEAGRAEGVRAAAEVAEGFDDPNRDWLRRSVWDEIKRDTAQRIRALSKEPTK